MQLEIVSLYFIKNCAWFVPLRSLNILSSWFQDLNVLITILFDEIFIILPIQKINFMSIRPDLALTFQDGGYFLVRLVFIPDFSLYSQIIEEFGIPTMDSGWVRVKVGVSTQPGSGIKCRIFIQIFRYLFYSLITHNITKFNMNTSVESTFPVLKAHEIFYCYNPATNKF